MKGKGNYLVSTGIITPHGWDQQSYTFLWLLGCPSSICESVVLLLLLCHLYEFPSLPFKELYICLLSVFPMRHKAMTFHRCIYPQCLEQSLHVEGTK